MRDHGQVYSAALTLRASGLLLLATLFLWGCEQTVVSVVGVSEVVVDPGELTLLEGAHERLSILLRDERGIPLSRTNVTWAVDDGGVVSVDQKGGVVALVPGSTRVRATVDGITGSATVTVLQGPTLSLSTATVELAWTASDSDPITTDVDIRNAGNGVLGQLAARVEGGSETSTGWLGMELLGTAAPTRLRLYVNPEGLEAGTYEARVVVESALTDDPPAELTVRLIVETAVNPGDPDPGDPDPGDPDPDDPEDPENPGPGCDIRDHIIFGNFEIPEETTCTIVNVRVLGDLRLGRGARVDADQLRVDGKLEAKDADALVLVESRILGDLKFEEGGWVTIRDTDIGKRLLLKRNRGDLDVRDSHVGDDFTVEDNRDGPFTLLRNTIAGNLKCKGNDPGPTGGENIVGGKKEGQCRGL